MLRSPLAVRFRNLSPGERSAASDERRGEGSEACGFVGVELGARGAARNDAAEFGSNAVSMPSAHALAEANGHAPSGSRSISTRRPRVRVRALVVEDDEFLRETMVELLADEGYAVASAATLGEARRALVEHAPDVMLLDLTLGGEFGADLLDELSDAPHPPATVIVSALPAASTIARRFGVRLVRKPFDVDALLDAIGAARTREVG